MKCTTYFIHVVMEKRPYLKRQLAGIQAIVERPVSEREQPDGRFRRWGWVGDEIYRVVVLADGVTVHNAFPDPNGRGILRP